VSLQDLTAGMNVWNMWVVTLNAIVKMELAMVMAMLVIGERILSFEIIFSRRGS
jgi:hypothetical protein